MLLLEARSLGVDKIGLSHHLQSCTLFHVSFLIFSCQKATDLRADIVEEELGASRAADVDTTGELDSLGLVGLAILEVREVLLKVADIVVDVELGPLVSGAVYPVKIVPTL